MGSKNRLKDVSSALTTSKELLKIINRIWAHADPPSSSLSLVSALHTELERARLQVNQLIQEQRSDKNEINHLMKCFAEEKASWRNKEQQAIEAAVGSVVSELEVERKLRRRLEILNKKLGKELAEMKSSFMNVAKELETEKRAREITEQVCDELARNIDEDRAQVERLKRESFKVHEEVEKERVMLQLADKWREERVQMKLSEAKHQFEEKNSALSKLRKQLEVFLGPKRDKDKEDDEEVVDAIDGKEDESAESELHSIELNMDNTNNNKNNKGYKWSYTKARNSVSGQVSQRTVPLQRSVSDGLDREGFHELEKEASRSSFVDESEGLKSVKGHKDRILSSSRFALSRENHGPSQQKEQSWPLRDPCGGKLLERSGVVQTTGSKSRTAVVRGEGQSVRRSKW